MKYILVVAFLLMSNSLAQAGDGHDHGEGAFANSSFSSSFELSNSIIKNLDIKISIVEKKDLQESMTLPCVIKNPPEQNSLISVLYMSRIERIHVMLGEKVKKGQVIFTVFSFKTAGNLDIKAPIDGVISAQNVKIGQIVQQETNIAEISTMKHFLAEGLAYLSDDISHINVGDIANIKIDGTHENSIGVVKAFSPIVDAQNKTKSILVYFDADDEHIFPNMHCLMNVYFGNKTNVIAVPKRALLGEFGNYFVFVKHDDHFERQEVVVGRQSGDNVEIMEGLDEGQEVVVNGNYQLQFVNASAVKEDDHEEEDND